MKYFLFKFKIISFLIFLFKPVQASPLETISWALTQLAPSYHVSYDKDAQDFHNGMAWDVTPVIITFWPAPINSYINFLIIEPEKRMTGSLEINTQISYYPGDEKNNYLMYNAGFQLRLPLVAYGEFLGFKLGACFAYMNHSKGVTLELGFYSFYSIFDITFAYHLDIPLQYSIQFNIKYF